MQKAVICAAVLTMMTGGIAQASGDNRPASVAYQLAFRCHAVATADGKNAEAFKATTAASKLAKTLGYSNRQFADDAIGYANYYGVRHRDRAALAEDRNLCRKFGFLA